MALPYNQVDSLVTKLIDSKLADGVYRSNAVLMRLNKKKKLVDGGDFLSFPIISSQPSEGEFYESRDTLSSDETDNITSATLQWKHCQEPVRIFNVDILKCSGKSAVLDLAATKVQIAEKQIKDKLGIGLHSDGTLKRITGFDAIMSASTTYGGIAVADFAQWIAQIDANGGTLRALTLPLLQKLFGQCSEDADQPTMGFCRQNVFDVIWGLYQPHQRVGVEDMMKLGFKALEFNGIPIVVDSKSKANSLSFINENYIDLRVHSQRDLVKEKISALETSDSYLTRIYWMGNLTCNNRRFQGRLEDIETLY